MFEKKSVVEFETPIACSQEELFLFHTDTNNLPKITPEGIEVSILKLPKQIAQDALIELRIKQFGISQKWVMQIAKYAPFEAISDLALSCPFSYFLHEREFVKLSDKSTTLRDRVTFTLPLWPLSLVALPIAKAQLGAMFAYRHQKTKEILEG